MNRCLAVAALFGVAAMATAQEKKPADAKPQTPPFVELLKLTPEEFIKRLDKDKDGLLSKDELPPGLARAFERMDRNGDGKLDQKEVEQMLKVMRERFGTEASKPSPASPQVERFVDSLLERMDTNKDGKISKEEARGPLADNFERLDANKDGYLDRSELRVAAARFIAMQGGGPGGPSGANVLDFDALDKNADGRLTRDEVKGTIVADQFDEIDANKDGKIDKKEFAAFLKKRAESAEKR